MTYGFYDDDRFDDDRFDRVATEAEAHAEWHRNAGVPMGQPGCPQDACHPDEYEYERDFAVEVGKPLPNGAIVVAAEPNGEYVVVLAVRPRREGWEASPWVTWKVDPDTGDAFWGDYMDDFDEAVRDFRERVAN